MAYGSWIVASTWGSEVQIRFRVVRALLVTTREPSKRNREDTHMVGPQILEYLLR